MSYYVYDYVRLHDNNDCADLIIILISWLLVNPKGSYPSESIESNLMNTLKAESFL